MCGLRGGTRNNGGVGRGNGSVSFDYQEKSIFKAFFNLFSGQASQTSGEVLIHLEAFQRRTSKTRWWLRRVYAKTEEKVFAPLPSKEHAGGRHSYAEDTAPRMGSYGTMSMQNRISTIGCGEVQMQNKLKVVY